MEMINIVVVADNSDVFIETPNGNFRINIVNGDLVVCAVNGIKIEPYVYNNCPSVRIFKERC